VEEATSSFLAELGHRITALSGDSREISFLFQRVSVLVERFNSVLLRESFSADSRPEDDLSFLSLIFSFLGNCYRGFKKS